MATHDYNLANQDGASFRSDLNNALAAIVSNNSSSTAPATTFAHQIWVDTTANVIKQRNAANDAWIELWRIDGGFNAKTFSSNVTLNAQSDLRFADSDSSNWVAFQAPATVASNVTWTLPSADGTADQALTTNGSGVLSWADAGGTTDNITEGNTSAEVVDTGSDGHFKVVTEGTEALRVDSSQRVGIGTATPTGAGGQVVEIYSSGSLSELHLTNSTSGNVGTRGLTHLLNGADAYAYNRENGAYIFGTNNAERARILSGGGLTFNGDTAAANALDDYEEGAWTPSMTFGGGSTGLTGNFSGSYTRIGRLVMAQFQLTLTNKGTSTGSLAVTGLPFTIGSNYHNVSGFSYMHRLNMGQTGGQIFIGATGTTMWIRRAGYSNSDAVLLDNGDFTNITNLWGGIVYHA